MGIKKCSSCGEYKKLDNFCKSKSRKDGLNVYCRQCTSDKGKLSRIKVKNNIPKLIEGDLKKCSKCGDMKEVSEFYKQSDKASGYMSQCKSCHKEYYLENEDFYKFYKHLHYIENKEHYSEKNRKWRNQNADRKREIDRIYQRKNRRKKYQRHVERFKNDPLYKLACNLRQRTNKAFKNKGYSKTSKTQEMLGCDWNFLMHYIEGMFKDGMTWNNYGEWHIDHIVPLSYAETGDELYMLCHYTNLQPLWGKDNMKKNNKFPNGHQKRIL
jgi:hypothetical protein